jgi:hypothetical protein
MEFIKMSEMIKIHVEALQDPNLNIDDFIKSVGYRPHTNSLSRHFFPELSENSICIDSGYAVGPNGLNILNCDLDIIVHYLLSNWKVGMKIVFDNSHEGGSGILYSRIHQVVKLSNIPHNNFYYINGLVNNIELYETFCLQNNIIEKINICAINTFEFQANATLKILKTPTIDNKPKEKTYLCFNRTLRPHRLILLSLLLRENLVDAGSYSFFQNNIVDNNLYNSFVGTHEGYFDKQLLDEAKKSYLANINRLPLRLNIEQSQNKISLDHDDYTYFENSLLSLVTETFYFEEAFKDNCGNNIKFNDGIFFTDKIFKPISMCHPFILVSRPHMLKSLRQLGYKTFSPFINEDYDDIEHNGERLIAIVNELKRIHNLSNEEKKKWIINVLPMAIHNYKHIKSKKDLSCFILNKNF